jgi:DNA polymerase bacteriophage-type
MTSLRIDFETRSTVDLKAAGVYPYAAHPTTDIWCMAWAFDEEEPEIWTPARTFIHEGLTGIEDNPLPQRVVEHIEKGGEVRAWNAQFERIIWREIMVKRYGAPEIALEQWHDTAAEAAAMALPRALGQAAEATGVPAQKDDKGYRLMLQMAKPRKIHPDGRIEWWDVPEKVATLKAYCKQDVRTESAMVKVIRRLTPRERELYLLDQRINDRGIRIDRPLVVAAQGIATEGVNRANLVMRQLTNGTVSEVTNHQALTAWLRNQGVDTDGVSKLAVKNLLEGEDLTEPVREALEIRADAGRSSVAKLQSFLDVAGDDDRLRGLLLYHAASTGRWAGRLVQPQNFPRGEVDDVEQFIPWILAGEYDAIDLFHPPIVVVSSMLRSMLIPGEGHDFVAGDLSAIEARVLNWLAGQEDMIELFRKFDAAPKAEKPNFDPYRVNAARLYKIPLAEVLKFPHRQGGKFQELSCGFGMGWEKAISGADTAQYGYLKLTPEFAKEVVANYRETHPQVKAFWYEAENACIAAIERPGAPVAFGDRGRIRAIKAGGYLYIILPSGRPLVYAAPRVVEAETPWGAIKPQIEISAVHSKTKQWVRERTYGGKIVENIVQAAARDIIAEGLLRSAERGYTPVLSVHDEIVAEVPLGFGSVEEFEALLTELPTWAEGCPVAAEGWRGPRYRK